MRSHQVVVIKIENIQEKQARCHTAANAEKCHRWGSKGYSKRLDDYFKVS